MTETRYLSEDVCTRLESACRAKSQAPNDKYDIVANTFLNYKNNPSIDGLLLLADPERFHPVSPAYSSMTRLGAFVEIGLEVAGNLKDSQAIAELSALQKQVPSFEKTMRDAVNYDCAKDTSVKDWYITRFPYDKDIASGITDVSFDDFFKMLNQNDTHFTYPMMANDSIVRERIFSQLSKMYNIEYKDVYNIWAQDPSLFKSQNIYAVTRHCDYYNEAESYYGISPITEENKESIIYDGDNFASSNESFNFDICVSIDAAYEVLTRSVSLENADLSALSQEDIGRLYELEAMTNDITKSLHLQNSYKNYSKLPPLSLDNEKNIEVIMVAFDDSRNRGNAFCRVDNIILQFTREQNEYCFYVPNDRKISISDELYSKVLEIVDKAFIAEIEKQDQKENSLADQIQNDSAHKAEPDTNGKIKEQEL